MNWTTFAVLAFLLQGVIVLFVKVLLGTTNPFSLLLFQYVGGFIGVSIYLLIKRRSLKIDKRNLLLVLLAGFFVSTGLLFYYAALSEANVSIVSPLQSVGLILTSVVLGFAFLKEKLTPKLVVGVAFALLSIFFLTF